MVTTPAEIGWGSYGNYEGPYFIGSIPYVMPANPDFLDMCDRVVTATEGGHYDSINMYDSCILSVGIIQVCARVGELTTMLGACASYDLGTMRTAFAQLPVPADLRQNPQGVWQFYFLDGRGFVTTAQQMQTMFLCGADGLKGQWTVAQKAQAKQVAATFANIWNSPSLQTGQNEFIKNRLMSYVMPRAKATLFTNPDQTGYAGALKAAFISTLQICRLLLTNIWLWRLRTRTGRRRQISSDSKWLCIAWSTGLELPSGPKDIRLFSPCCRSSSTSLSQHSRS